MALELFQLSKYSQVLIFPGIPQLAIKYTITTIYQMHGTVYTYRLLSLLSIHPLSNPLYVCIDDVSCMIFMRLYFQATISCYRLTKASFNLTKSEVK